MKIILKHESGIIETPSTWVFAPDVFIFGALAALSRGDVKWFIAMLPFDFYIIWGQILSDVADDGAVILIVAWILRLLLSLVYNQFYIKGLLLAGFRPADELSKQVLVKKKLISEN